VSFNPSGNSAVDALKERVAALIDDLAPLAADRDRPGAREAAIAMTQFEEAAMWAVKALTKPARPGSGGT
jgi:hypothetical protein